MEEGEDSTGVRRGPKHAAGKRARRSRERLTHGAEDFLALTADWLWETDADHRWSWIEKNIGVSTGPRTAPLIGRSRVDGLERAIADPEELAAHLADLAARRPFRDLLHEVKGAQGETLLIALSGMPRFDASGHFAGYGGTARNVTAMVERARLGRRHPNESAGAEDRSRELLADMQRTVDAMQMGVLLLDADLNVEIVNKAFYEIWSMSRDDIWVGSSFRTLLGSSRHKGVYGVPDDEWDAYVEMRVDELRDGDIVPREMTRADGSTLIYSVTALPSGKRLLTYYDVTEMKLREDALAHALERAHLADAVLNGIEDPVFVKDGELRFVLVNEAFAAGFGVTPQEMRGKRASDYVGGSEGALFEKTERDVLDSGHPYEIQEDFDLAGSDRTRVVRKNRISTASGRTYVAGFVFDITDIRRREREADEARRRLTKVLETIPSAVVIYDREDRFVLANGRAQERLRPIARQMRPGSALRPLAEAAHAAGLFRSSGDPRLDALYDSDREAWIEGYVARHHVDHSISECREPDGRWFQVHDTRTEDGLYVGVRIDITALKEREAALRETTRENELFRSLIDNVPVAIYAKRSDLRLAYVNRGWCDLTGFSRDVALGRTDAEIFGADGEAFMDGDRAVLESGEMQVIEEVVSAPEGGTRHQIARKGAMIASDGSPYLIGSTMDVTELKQREQQLRDAERRAVLADRAKSEFLANMSHEIRTPMNGVLGMAELLAKTDLDAKQKTFTDIILKSGNALLTIINDILDFSKIDAGQLVLDPVPFGLAEAVEDVATLMSARTREKDLELVVRIDPALPRTLLGDVGRLRQIITNLVGNAVKFTDAGHVLVNVSGEVTGTTAEVEFRVTDTGIGIPRDRLASVFEKFSQVDASSTRRHEGTGLGLAITARLVALMGGEIGVDSEVGRGSTFMVRLAFPVCEGHGSRKTTPLDVTGARILVVDDNAVNRLILMEQMTAWGFDACAAENGREAMAVLHATARMGLSVDCIVLDHQMPGMSGTDVARDVRATPAIADTPIVMLTSVDQSLTSAQHAALRIGAQLIKPARSWALLDAIVTEVQRSRGRQPAEGAIAPVEPVPQTIAASAAEAPPPASAAAPRAQTQTVSRLDILVAEDNEVNQLVFAQILGEARYTFEIVRNGRLAVAAATEMRPGLILMDVSMPEMNGLEATQAIRAEEAGSGRHVPIVGVTAHALKGDRERCLAAGMDDYLSKPISPNALLAKVQLWLDQPEQIVSQTG